jgi:hypothetical protein
MRKSIGWAVLLLAFFIVTHSYAADDYIASLYPLEKGSYWIYKGNIKWTPEGVDQKVRSQFITWKMTVHEIVESADCRIAVVSGFPGDLAWYDEGTKPKYSLIVLKDKCVHRHSFESQQDALAAARKIAAGDKDSLNALNCMIEFPLVKGKKYDLTDESRQDNMYAWYVEQVDKVNIKVKGYKSSKRKDRFKLIYRTLPDHIIMYFVPGLGITRYVYNHHGTAAFEDLRLVEYGTRGQ